MRCVAGVFVAFLFLYPSSWLLCVFVSPQPSPPLLAAGVFDSFLELVLLTTCAFVSGYVPHALSLGRGLIHTRIHEDIYIYRHTYIYIYGASPSAAGPLDNVVARWLSG